MSPHPPQLPAAHQAPPVRTLVDILEATAGRHPEAPALDDGETVLSYAELLDEVKAVGRALHAAGLGAGDRIGIRIPSGTVELYVSILATLYIGAAYVPVDADDPDERARLVFSEARVAGILGGSGQLRTSSRRPKPFPAPRPAAPGDDAWIIFTSGSTGTPKGVAVTHRNAAAFVDAEARLFLQDDPLGPGDRVLAGLSVAFDASCEEMWLAWRSGACLVPAPRSLVRSGMDLGPWLVSRSVNVVSTVPTLAALWPPEALENVRLLIFGGEACPPELAARLAEDDRELWNTYGPTEATVVACAARMDGTGPVRIGLPLDGWDLAVVDSATGVPVAEGETGELIIGGVGLARYLDPAKDAEKYAPLPSLGWDRAYRSGDLVVWDPEGLLFVGRADEQVKLGGRRIELGEVDAALQSLPGVAGGAAAVKTTPAGTQLLIGYLAVPPSGPAPDLEDLRSRLEAELPAALVPRLVTVEDLPTKTSGKVDRAALPWPLPGQAGPAGGGPGAGLPVDPDAPGAWVLAQWADVLGAAPEDLDSDFFASGGGSLAAAQLVSRLRTRYPTVTVRDVYAHPRAGALVEAVTGNDGRPVRPAEPVEPRPVARTTRKAQVFQTLMGLPLFILVAMRWVVYLAAGSNVAAAWGILPAAPTVSWWWVAAAWLVFVSPPGRMLLSVAAARLLLREVAPGSYPRSGRVHLRLWLAQHVADLVDPVSLGGALWVPTYARLLGARIGRDVDLHSVPPVTGFLELGDGASVEPEVDLSGYWIDGDVVHVGRLAVGPGAVVGSRSTLMPGASVGAGTRVQPGSTVTGRAKDGLEYAGSPAERLGKAKDTGPNIRPPRATGWLALSALGSGVLALLPFASAALAALLGLWSLTWWPDWQPGGAGSAPQSLVGSAWRLLAASPLVAAAWFGLNMLSTVVAVRLMSVGVREGHHAVRSRIGWQLWATERVLDTARDLLFPLYASRFTPTWLRWLGAEVGRNVEASTVILQPALTQVGDDAFLADDTMVGSYELQRGWMYVAPAKVGRKSFVGNSGMVAAGRKLSKNSLVAVLSSSPRRTKAGSSWLGSPPVRLRRTEVESADAVTYAPSRALKRARTAWELLRAVPVWVSTVIALLVAVALEALAHLGGGAAEGAGPGGWWLAALLGGAVLLAAGALAAGSSVLAKKALVGRIEAGEHPLWSSFIWRNEVVDTFVEMVSAPWFGRLASGTPSLVWWLRALGARIGHGVWCESYWLPEADLVTLGDSATVNRGCVVQTHLFHDRVMSIDAVELGAGATLGPNSVILPAASIGEGGTVGAGSLVMRGETVPGHTWWIGNPVAPWKGPKVKGRAAAIARLERREAKAAQAAQEAREAEEAQRAAAREASAREASAREAADREAADREARESARQAPATPANPAAPAATAIRATPGTPATTAEKEQDRA
ncbi:Pls/PosA family non-ribosomal peptide synthetase [Citricoccus sp. SGAir0253]|uniref:Pls/PosA family non-ribosomal peptide synthetase n=1 Tax=Citricoccus sp. SGAir0253 TaxID=2567881 RepID=UPI001FF051FE|nr:Pls/PosA family non-ribosomal peptide synthetase [Citricoccus sp. SGAir0253]